jgi:hypothetical protein
MSTTTTTAGAHASVFRYSIVSCFAAGFISVLLFQMGAIAILHALGLVPFQPFGYALTKPLSVPQIWSFAFWGGIWGIVYGAIEQRFPEGPLYYVAAFLFGAIAPVLVLWFIVFPLKGAPVAAGWDVSRMIMQVIFHGCFGLGIGVLLKWRSAT